MIIIGIDPGRTGAVAVLTPSFTKQGGHDASWYPMPEDLGRIIADFEWYRDSPQPCHVYIEKAQSFPKGGVAGMFNYGVHYGQLLGIIQALNIPMTPVPPRTWTKVMHAGTKAGKPKDRSLEACRRLFPNVKLTATDLAKKPHDGAVDALLIAEHGRRALKEDK